MAQAIVFKSPAALSVERIKMMFTVRERGRYSGKRAAIEMGDRPDIAMHRPDCTARIQADGIYISIPETIIRVPKSPLCRIGGANGRWSERKENAQKRQSAKASPLPDVRSETSHNPLERHFPRLYRPKTTFPGVVCFPRLGNERAKVGALSDDGEREEAHQIPIACVLIQATLEEATAGKRLPFCGTVLS